MENSATQSPTTQIVTWYRPEKYSTIHPRRGGVALLAVTNLKTEHSAIAEGQMWTDDDGKVQWGIDSIWGIRMVKGCSVHGFTEADFRLDSWADVLTHPRYLNQ